MPRTLTLAENAFDDKACPCCYYAYIKKFLCKAEKKALYCISYDCFCDFQSDDQDRVSVASKPDMPDQDRDQDRVFVASAQ